MEVWKNKDGVDLACYSYPVAEPKFNVYLGIFLENFNKNRKL